MGAKRRKNQDLNQDLRFQKCWWSLKGVNQNAFLTQHTRQCYTHGVVTKSLCSYDIISSSFFSDKFRCGNIKVFLNPSLWGPLLGSWSFVFICPFTRKISAGRQKKDSAFTLLNGQAGLDVNDRCEVARMFGTKPKTIVFVFAGGRQTGDKRVCVWHATSMSWWSGWKKW